MAQDTDPHYWIWTADNSVRGPIELPTLVNWIRESRMNTDTWVYANLKNTWQRAADLPELQLLFHPRHQGDSGTAVLHRHPEQPSFQWEPEVLRCIKIFSDWDDQRLKDLVHYMELQCFRQFEHVVRRGDHGDAMFIVLDGELRVRVHIDQKESILATLKQGDFFGEISLLDEGPRSADVIANQDSALLKISTASFYRLVKEAPAMATPFLLALSRSLVGRMRNLSKQYQDSIHMFRSFGE